MGYYIIITNNNGEQYEFVTVNGKVKAWYSETDALDVYSRTIEKYGADNVSLLYSINVKVTTEVNIQ